jgi:RNA recognition motif-containing protein
LSDSVDQKTLERLFAPYGTVRTVHISVHVDTGRNTGDGFVEMESDDGAAAAIAALNLNEHYGRILSIRWSEITMNRLPVYREVFGPMNMSDDETTGNKNQ